MRIEVKCGNCGELVSATIGEGRVGVVEININEDHCCRSGPSQATAINELVAGYEAKIHDQSVLASHASASLRRKRGRREDYSREANELRVIRARKQAYVQAQVDIESILDN